MNRFSWVTVAALLCGIGTAEAQNTVYWDRNGSNPGATDPPGIADGTWDTAATNWNPVADGTGTTQAWVAGDNAVFSAGNDVGSIGGLTDGAFVTVSGTQTAASVLIEEGYVAFRSGTVDTGAGAVTINAGATLDIDSTLRLNLTAGKVVLNGGTLLNTNPAAAPGAGSFIGGNASSATGDGGGMKGLEINGIGYIGFSNNDGIPDNAVSIFGGVITGVGGTTTNGGAGTLVKIGPDQIGIAVTDQDFTPGAPRIHSQSLFTFAKLEVREGAYRLRNGTQDGTVRETAFGAVPLAELADAITLNGGGIGSNTTVTLHANRGVTIGPNGGYFDHGAGASLVIPGPLSGSGALTIGSPTSAATSNVTFTLSHANNVNTFTGALVGVRGVLQLNSSLKAAGLLDSSGATSGANVATVNIAAGQTLTVGTGNGSDTWSTVIGGAGGFTKVGTGTQTLAGTPTYGGDTRVEGGTLSIANPYLANASDVYISTGAALNMTFSATDVIDQLLFDNMAQAAGLWGAVGNAGATFTSPLLTGTGLLSVTTGPVAGVPGDYNDNGTVDAADYVLWRKGLPLQNEVATIGTNTPEDYTEWRARFGNTTPGAGSALGAGAVPEPTTLALVLVSLAAVVRGRRVR